MRYARGGGVAVAYQVVGAGARNLVFVTFLERQPDGSYEAADTKLARTSKPAHILQLCFYTEQLARLTGREPAFMHVVLGSGLRDSYRPGDFMAYYRRVRLRFLDFVADPPETYPLPVSICDFSRALRDGLRHGHVEQTLPGNLEFLSRSRLSVAVSRARCPRSSSPTLGSWTRGAARVRGSRWRGFVPGAEPFGLPAEPRDRDAAF